MVKHKIARLRTGSGKSPVREISLAKHDIYRGTYPEGQEHLIYLVCSKSNLFVASMVTVLLANQFFDILVLCVTWSLF